ncbi:MAG: DUF2813 domain-containing protein [Clostridia bacterium]|nr:DUF2813 domain-containing protein [Clostridia bacterium]
MRTPVGGTMIKEIRIQNFKGIEDLWLDFSQLNVLIGANSAGKSTIIQAIDLLMSSVHRDIPEYLDDRGWKVEDIKSQISKNRKLAFDTLLSFDIAGDVKYILWSIEFVLTQKDNSVVLASEQFSIVSNSKIIPSLRKLLDAQSTYPESILIYGYNRGYLIFADGSNNEPSVKYRFKSLNISSSILKVFHPSTVNVHREYVDAFQDFFHNSQSLETLSTDRLRRSSRGQTKGIGTRGERLAAFVKQMNDEQKARFMRNLRQYMPSITSLDTVVKGKPGWIELILNEKYGENNIRVKTSHISDGFLRIIAFVSLMELESKPGLIVFDEIEDGINPHIASEIVKLISSYGEKCKRQLILTTHSSLMLDEFDPSNIVYVYRDSRGGIRAKHVYLTDNIKSMLDYMNPGEIWINSSEQELLGSDDED